MGLTVTIRFLALLTLCCAIAVAWDTPSFSTRIEQTGRELDVAIVGRGYFVVTSPDDHECYYTRSGALTIDETGRLAIPFEGKHWPVSPPISIPNEWTRIAIQPDGQIDSYAHGTWMDIGQLELATFTTTPTFADDLRPNRRSDESGPPLISIPSHTTGTFQQYWLECNSNSQRKLLVRILIALLATITLNLSFAAWQRNGTSAKIIG